MSFVPGYIRLHQTGELQERIEALREILKSCCLCPRECHVNRLEDEAGYCRAGRDLTVSSVFPHYGEEPPLVGRCGSGTIFLTYCNLRCSFCQNFEISHMARGERISAGQMAQYMIDLQKVGCHNINLVTPTHYDPQIVATLPHAVELGLRLPLVYNCGGYESLDVLRLLDGIIDIYMPDAKFSSPEVADRLCKAPDYPRVVQSVLKEMHRQVGDLVINGQGIAERGLLIRHLVMPNGLAGTDALMEFIARELSPQSYVNIMAQYRPEYRAHEYPDLDRRIRPKEFQEALDAARRYGLKKGAE